MSFEHLTSCLLLVPSHIRRSTWVVLRSTPEERRMTFSTDPIRSVVDNISHRDIVIQDTGYVGKCLTGP